MMNIIWCIMLIAGIISAIIGGNAGIVTDSLIEGCSQAVTLCIELLGAYMLWSGLMEIAKDMGAVDKLAKKMQPVLGRIFPDANEACAPIALNFAANFFGMGSAAQPFGIEAMQIMQRDNKDKITATDNMCMFIALNASALDLLPMTVLALRTTSGADRPYEIVVPVAVASVAGFLSALISCKIFSKFSRCST